MNNQKCYIVAGHKVAIIYNNVSSGDEALLTNFDPFLVKPQGDFILPGEVALTLVVDNQADIAISSDEIGQFDCGGCNHGVYQTAEGGYQFEVSNVQGELCSTMESNPDFTQCRVKLHHAMPSMKRYGLNNAMMMAYAFCFSSCDTVLVHASVIRKDGYGYLMIAPSGTGKSTHTHLWFENIPGCDLMNDDNPIVRLIDGQAHVYGSPWSGKTPCYRNVQAPVGAFVRIQQRPRNEIRRLSPLDAYTELLTSMSNMKWDRRVYTHVVDTIIKIVACVGIYELGCLPNGEAARLCYETVAAKK
ncbi:MAG: hypothetical protein KBT12_07530 [Bacteroidales bacterium]|nr:hypothetical protein [Candidatus Physcousia equi]